MFNSQSDQLPAGLIAQLVEHCIGNAEVMGLKSRSDLSLFSDLNFTIAFMYNCDDQAWLHDVYWSLLPRSSLRWQYKNLGAFFTADYGRELKASKVTFRWNVNYTWYKRQLRLEVLLTCQVFSARCSRAHRVCTAYAPCMHRVLSTCFALGLNMQSFFRTELWSTFNTRENLVTSGWCEGTIEILHE